MGQCSADGFGPAHVVLGCGRIKGVQLFGGESDCNDLHRLCSTAWTTASATLQFDDVVAGFRLVCPVLDLLLGHHMFIV